MLKDEPIPIPQRYRILGKHFSPNNPETQLTVEAKGGNRTFGTACTAPLPENSFIIVDTKAQQPRAVPGFSPGYFGDTSQAALITPEGAQKEVCFNLLCGNSGGGGPVCIAELEGKMDTLSWAPTTMPAEIEQKRLDMTLFNIKKLPDISGTINK